MLKNQGLFVSRVLNFDTVRKPYVEEPQNYTSHCSHFTDVSLWRLVSGEG
ncbi:hypothetical protein SBDP1_1170020 [Syntrophobacter sp. SbD1]|nr:hypothetical protein SBDP1_1170020 [Syntrophobacter sp. SbD1]